LRRLTVLGKKEVTYLFEPTLRIVPLSFDISEDFRLQLSVLGMRPFLEELEAIVQSEELLNGCSSTRNAVVRCYLAFRHSGRFAHLVPFRQISILFNINQKTVWGLW
jgi:hypothetical protein